MAKILSMQPPQDLVEQYLSGFVDAEMEQFSIDLATARRIWRNHRALVEAQEYPEPYCSFEIRMSGEVPDDNPAGYENDGLPVEELRARLRPQAERMAQLARRARRG